MSLRASGPFEVKLTPMAPDAGAEAAAIGRMTLDKQFHGELEATSKGLMVAVRTAIANSAGYVALERVTGVLNGKAGSFALQHSGTMTRGEAKLEVTIVPDSGADELAGIAGAMKIVITEGNHFYELDYTLPG